MLKKIPYTVSVLIPVVVAGYFIFQMYQVSSCKARYPLINAEIVCSEAVNVISKAGYAELRGQLEEYIESKNAGGVVTDVALYFRDLKQGPVMGINERADYAPASLLKLPLAILYLSREEAEPGFLDAQPNLLYTIPADSRTEAEKAANPSALNLGQAFPPPAQIEPKKPYNVEDLLFRLLAYSDNRANELLAEHALATLGGDEAFVEIYRDLGMIDSESIGDETITVRSYASIFRLLYHANYLNPDLSEKALEWLSRSSFKEGLEAGVPKGVRVAHKFGERESLETDTQQLHDCGVVYYPGNPYLLCVMTKGRDVFKLADVIADISRMVYEEVDSRRLQ